MTSNEVQATGFIRTTAIGGAFFLLPLVAVGWLVSQLMPIIKSINGAIEGWFPHVFDVPGGFVILTLLACLVLLLLCFVAGLLARRSLASGLSATFERNLMLLWPKYAVIKENMSDKIGGAGRCMMKPVLIEFKDYKQVGFETSRVAPQGLVVVYLPGAPDAWSGTVALVQAERVEPLEIGFGDAVSVSEQLGRNVSKLLATAENPVTA